MSMDKDFIKEGQKCFRAYYKVVNNQAYEKMMTRITPRTLHL